MTGQLRGGVTVPVIGCALVLVGLSCIWAGRIHSAANEEVRAPRANPFAGRGVYLDPESEAAIAALRSNGPDRELLARLAAVPVGIWLTPETAPVESVGAYVSTVAQQAHAAKKTALFVVYGIEGRDCASGQSAGGLAPGPYRAWVHEIAAAAGKGTVVILEPDALATAPQCHRVGQRERLLSQAVRTLAATHTAVYLDAGHADWVDASAMARMLRKSGVRYARGFAVNVAGYGRTRRERGYARAVVHARGGSHFVIDTSRNGAGPGRAWCNPRGRALGVFPHALRHGRGLDAVLWIKPPGESDGSCNGGPPAGEWWTKEALSLARNSGW